VDQVRGIFHFSYLCTYLLDFNSSD
jgi:hypothetical protein